MQNRVRLDKFQRIDDQVIAEIVIDGQNVGRVKSSEDVLSPLQLEWFDDVSYASELDRIAKPLPPFRFGDGDMCPMDGKMLIALLLDKLRGEAVDD